MVLIHILWKTLVVVAYAALGIIGLDILLLIIFFIGLARMQSRGDFH